jgi:hypothetical protein
MTIAFCKRLIFSLLYFCLYSIDTEELGKLATSPWHDNDFRFDRIDVSNITEGSYLGIRSILLVFSPLLRTPEENPFAILVISFVRVLY